MTYTVNWYFAGTAFGITAVSGIALLVMRRASKRPEVLYFIVGIVFWLAAFVAFFAALVVVQILIDPHTQPTLGN
jgi:hypothetical protein